VKRRASGSTKPIASRLQSLRDRPIGQEQVEHTGQRFDEGIVDPLRRLQVLSSPFPKIVPERSDSESA
jgi:hypothetical protein